MPNSTSPAEIEVKFAVAPGDLAGVRKALPQALGKGEDYAVHFFDLQPLRLFGQGLIIRLRQRPVKGDDATLKVRGDGAVAALEAVGGGTTTVSWRATRMWVLT